MNALIRIVLLVLNPIILISAFWSADLTNVRLIYLPVFGIATIFLGAGFAFAFAKWKRLPNDQIGSMFVSGAFLNLGSFGMLFCVLFIGEEAVAYAAMFRLLEEFTYYTIIYPIAKSYGSSEENAVGSRLMRILKDPFIMITFFSIVIGAILNLTPIDRFGWLGASNSALVALASILLLIPIGFSMRIASVKTYWKRSIWLIPLKFLVVPLIITGTAYLIGLGNLYDGILLQVLLIMSAMPPAVASLVPPRLYNLDMELANSNWIVTTSSLIFVLPILFAVVHWIA
jgi:predicted permease